RTARRLGRGRVVLRGGVPRPRAPISELHLGPPRVPHRVGVSRVHPASARDRRRWLRSGTPVARDRREIRPAARDVTGRDDGGLPPARASVRRAQAALRDEAAAPSAGAGLAAFAKRSRALLAGAVPRVDARAREHARRPLVRRRWRRGRAGGPLRARALWTR